MDIAQLGFEVRTDSIQKGRKELGRFSQQSDKATKSMGAAGSAAKLMRSAFAGIGVALVFNRTTNAIIGFEDSMLKLQATSRASAKDLKLMEAQARTLGATTRYSAQQAASAQNFLAMAGFNTGQILAATGDVISFASAASLDLAQSADIASNVLGQMKLPVSELSMVMDAMINTAQSSNTSVLQLADAFGFVAPIAASANIEVTELAAAIGVLGDSGIQGGRAGTDLTGVIRSLLNITPNAEKALSKYGLQVQDVDVTTKGLTSVLQKLGDANLSTSDAITIFGSRAASAALILSNTADNVDRLAKSNELAGGRTQEVAKLLDQGLSAALASVNSAIEEFMISTGDSGLKGTLKGLAVTTAGVINSFNGMLPQFAEANGLTPAFTRNIELLTDAIKLITIAVGVRFVGAIMGNVAAFGLAQLSALRYQSTLATMAGVSQVTAVRLGIMSVAARTASASMALLGGPLGVITVAALALTYFATRSTEAEKEAKALDLRINSLGNSFDGLGKKQAAATLLDYTKKQENLGKELSIVSARAEYLNMQIQQFGKSPNADKWREDLIVIEGKQEDLVKQMEAGNKAMSELKRIMDSDPLAPIVKGTESASEAFNTLNRQMDEQILKIKAKNDAELLAARINAGYIDGLLTSEGKLLVSKQKAIDLLIEQKKAEEERKRRAQELGENLLAQEAHYKRMLTLVGDVTEAERLNYEMKHGALQGLLPQQQASLMLMAEQVDALNNSKHFWAEWSDAALTALTDFDTLAASVVDNFTSGFGNAFESMIIDSENLGDAMKTMAQGLVRAFVNAIGQMIAQWLAYQAVQLIVGKSTQTSAVAAMTANAQATSLQAGLAAFASTAAIPIVGPAAAPAAMGAALGVTQPMVGAVAASASAGLAGMAHDGMDSIPATGTWLLEKGERVTTAETSAKLDRKLDQLGSNGQNVSIMQEIIIEGNASEQDVELLREAARQGAEEGYRAVYNDFRNNGPIRRSVGV